MEHKISHMIFSNCGSKTIYSRLLFQNKENHRNLLTSSSLKEGVRKKDCLMLPTAKSWKIKDTGLKQSVQSSFYHDHTKLVHICWSASRRRPQKRWSIFCQQRGDGEIDAYLKSLMGCRVINVSFHFRQTVSFRDRKTFTLDDKYRITFNDSMWFGLDGELPETEESDQDDRPVSAGENHPKLETGTDHEIVPVTLVIGPQYVPEVVTVIVPVNQKRRQAWMRIDFTLSRGDQFKNIIVSYIDFNLLNDYAWIDGRPIKVPALVEDLTRRLSRDEDIHVVTMKAEKVHGYQYMENRWFAMVQLLLLAGSSKVVVGDLNNHLGTGLWPSDIPYKEGCQGDKNITYVPGF